MYHFVRRWRVVKKKGVIGYRSALVLVVGTAVGNAVVDGAQSVGMDNGSSVYDGRDFWCRECVHQQLLSPRGVVEALPGYVSVRIRPRRFFPSLPQPVMFRSRRTKRCISVCTSDGICFCAKTRKTNNTEGAPEIPEQLQHSSIQAARTKNKQQQKKKNRDENGAHRGLRCRYTHTCTRTYYM